MISTLNAPKLGQWLLLLLAGVFIVNTSYRKGNDINVYLHASEQLISGEDPYTDNPYNEYLYSPSFALLLAPLSFPPQPIGRVIWSVLSSLMLWRCWRIGHQVLRPKENARLPWWTILIALLSINAFVHNINLGQVTMFILWCMLEGLYQMRYGKAWLGALLLALGVNVKIVPALLFYPLVMRGEWSSSFRAGAAFIGLMLLPLPFFGWTASLEFYQHWWDMINPSRPRFATTVPQGCVSLNCWMSRSIADASLASILTNGMRLTLLIGLGFTLIKTRKNNEAEQVWKAWAMSILAIMLFFPHQMKYSMLFILPAAAYLIHKILRAGWKWDLRHLLTAFILILPAIMGRDIISAPAVEWLGDVSALTYCNIGLFLLLVFEGKTVEPTHARPPSAAERE